MVVVGDNSRVSPLFMKPWGLNSLHYSSSAVCNIQPAVLQGLLAELRNGLESLRSYPAVLYINSRSFYTQYVEGRRGGLTDRLHTVLGVSCY